jgi:Zn-dependent protease with chaperone function
MTLGLCFWILMLIWLVFSVAVHFGVVGGLWAGGDILLLFLLFLLLGWQVFGPPLHR